MIVQPKTHIYLAPNVAKQHVQQLNEIAGSIRLDPSILFQLLLQYGDKALPIITSIAAAFQGGFSWGKLGNVLATNGPMVYGIAQQIAAALGYTLPALPAIPKKPNPAFSHQKQPGKGPLVQHQGQVPGQPKRP